jgi:putative tryptophan/tyrosine transport system substrate-binding protein
MAFRKLVGVLYGGYPQPWHDPFTQKLSEHYHVDSRYARGQWGDNIREMARSLVNSECDVLVTMDTPAMNAVLDETDTIPTVSLACGLRIGARNLTGLVNKEVDAVRQLRMLVELLKANNQPFSPISVLYNHDNPAMRGDAQEIEAAARQLSPAVEILPLPVSGPEYDFDKVLESSGNAKALQVLEEPVTVQYRKTVAHFVLGRNIPAMYETRTYLDEGGLLSYGPDRAAMYVRMADFVCEILDNNLQTGALPPMEEVEPSLLLNASVANRLGITRIPDTLDGVPWAA